MKVGKIYSVTGRLPERMRMITLNNPQPSAQVKPDSSVNLNDYLLPQDKDSAIIIRIDEDSDDFRCGDLLVVDIDRKPAAGDFTVFTEDNSYFIEKWQFPDYGRLTFGVVTSIIRKLVS